MLTLGVIYNTHHKWIYVFISFNWRMLIYSKYDSHFAKTKPYILLLRKVLKVKSREKLDMQVIRETIFILTRIMGLSIVKNK